MDKSKRELCILFIASGIKRFLLIGVLAAILLYGYFGVCYWNDANRLQKQLGDDAADYSEKLQERWGTTVNPEKERGYAEYILQAIASFGKNIEIESLLPGGVVNYSVKTCYGKLAGPIGVIAETKSTVGFLHIRLSDEEALVPIKKEDLKNSDVAYSVFSCSNEDLQELVAEISKIESERERKEFLETAKQILWLNGEEFLLNTGDYPKEGYHMISQEDSAPYVLILFDSPGQNSKTMTDLHAEAHWAFRQVGNEMYGISRLEDRFFKLPFVFGDTALVWQKDFHTALEEVDLMQVYWNFDSFWEVNRDRIRKVIIAAYILVFIVAVWGAYAVTQKRKRQLDTQNYTKTLMNSMAHDLKTPLTVIGGFAENCKEDPQPERRQYYLEEIEKNVQYMSNIISGNLELFRMENEGLPNEREVVDLVELCKEQFEHFNELLKEAGITVSIKGSYKVKASKKWMNSAVENLVSNCLKYTKKGSEILVEGKTHSFRIQNNTDMEYTGNVKRFWQPFVMGEESRTGKKGTGLGLSIVHSVLERHKMKHYIRYDKMNHCFAVVIWRV